MSEIKKYSPDQTMEILVNTDKSICRFGDGELKIIYDSNYNIGFQKNNIELQNKLKSILTERPNDNVLVSIVYLDQPNVMIDEKKRNSLLEIVKLKNSDYIFGAANITRNIKYIPEFKKIWNDKDILIIEGEYTRSGVGNDLFDNTKSIKRLICPATNAFKKYDDIYDYVIKNVNKSNLLLCSLGPTATILSYDLSQLGYRILDIGHLDILYEWRKIGPDKYIIKGKYVNEVNGGNNIKEIGECIDENYKSQIIKKII